METPEPDENGMIFDKMLFAKVPAAFWHYLNDGPEKDRTGAALAELKAQMAKQKKTPESQWDAFKQFMDGFYKRHNLHPPAEFQ